MLRRCAPDGYPPVRGFARQGAHLNGGSQSTLGDARPAKARLPVALRKIRAAPPRTEKYPGAHRRA
jgi:hypothetical protein